MVPLLRTDGATNAARPLLPTVMLPSLTTAPWSAPVIRSLLLPDMKALLLMSAVEATMPAASTRAVLPKNTPFGLRIQTWPLACRPPSICDGSVEPFTRLTAMEEEFGWTKFVCALEPILKLRQSITVRLEDWLTVSVLPDWETDALPPVTFGSCGSAPGSRASAGEAPKKAEAAPNITSGRESAEVLRKLVTRFVDLIVITTTPGD